MKPNLWQRNGKNNMHTKRYKVLSIGLCILFCVHNSLDAMRQHDKIYVAGHGGLVGSAIIRELKAQGYTNIIIRSSKELDLRDQVAVNQFFQEERPDYVFLAAARVGGIKANMVSPAVFLYENLMIEANVIHAAYMYSVKKLLFLGSSCIYPRLAPQPMKEDYLLTSQLEPTNEGYAIAKIAGLKMCQAYNKQYGTRFITCMPTNIYGPGDNFNLETAHALPALMAKMHKAKHEGFEQVVVWGTGNARREWLYVDDLAQACVYLMNTYEGNEIVNIGLGQDISMKDLAFKIREIVGYQGELVFDATKPEGMPRKLLDVSKANGLGWHATVDLSRGLVSTYAWYNTKDKD